MTMNIIDVFLLAHAMSCFWIRFNQLFMNVDKHIETYINSFYFIYSTATGLGYGDITINKSDEGDLNGRYCFAIMLMFMALVYFAFVQSMIVNLLKKWEKINNNSLGAFTEMEDWLVIRNNSGRGAIPWLLERKVFHYFKFLMQWDISSILCENGFLEKLGYTIKETLREYLASEIIRKFEFFRDVSPEYRSKIALTAKLVK